MNVGLLAAAVLYLLAVLAAAGWLLSQSIAHAVAFIAGGLLCQLVAGLPVVQRVG